MSRVIKSSKIVLETNVKPCSNNENIEDIKTKEKELLQAANQKYDAIILDAQTRAEEILQKAHNDADSLINSANQASKNIEEQAQKQGYDAGFSEGYEEGKTKSDELIIEANHIKETYLIEQRRTLESIEKDTIELVLTICEDILHQKLNEDKEAIIAVIKKGLQNLSSGHKIVIRVSPNDYDIVELSKDRLLAMSSKIENIEVKSDLSLSVGDCMIDTPKGSIDASVQKQMNQVKNILLDLLNNSE